MGILGRYLDSLNDEQKDRVVRATGWTSGEWIDLEGARRCVVAHACNWPDMVGDVDEEALREAFAFRESHGRTAYDQFDALCRRFGKDRVVRAIKLRAGATLHEVAERETVEV